MKKAVIILINLLTVVPALAEGMVETASTAVGNSAFFALGASLAIGMAALGGALAQGKIGSSAMDGIARNPQAQKSMFVSMVLGLVLIESLVIYALIIAFMLVTKL
ncbi:MAG: ATP synthase F0 subunit C [Flavobacteriales bacterium]|nr:ATP synthase F0 subunit C [Flavobacteriales bacterium]